MPPRDLHEAGTGLLRLSDDPELLLDTPPTAPFNSGNDLHAADCLRT